MFYAPKMTSFFLDFVENSNMDAPKTSDPTKPVGYTAKLLALAHCLFRNLRFMNNFVCLEVDCVKKVYNQ
jgi:hypothetical protein